MVTKTFKIRFMTRDGEVIKCAQTDVFEDHKAHVDKIEFVYHPDFRKCTPYPIDPKALPFDAQLIELPCTKAVAGFIDDILPDSWGKKVLARIHNIRYPTTTDLLDLMEYSTIGALHFSSDDNASVSFGLGCNKSDLIELQALAKKIDIGLLTDEEIEQYKLAMFARGSSVGGARPKVLVHDDNKAYIAKFSKEEDKFDYATVEHACLKLMEEASLSVAQSEVIKVGVNNVLLVERFDVTSEQGRYHQITANALLKDMDTQSDPFTSSYDDIVKLISHYSCKPLQDKQQLLGQMLFNVALNNTDDHLRNFSFTCKEDGWQLSPAYDVVPSTDYGSYHQLKLGYDDILPSHSTILRYHRKFGLTKAQTDDVAKRVRNVLVNWQASFRENGVNEADILLLSKLIKTE